MNTVTLDGRNHTEADNGFEMWELWPPAFNIVLLVASMTEMYNRIEISHPVYSVLFCNLAAALVSSLADLVFPFIQSISYDILVSSSGTSSIFIHCWSWSVLTVIRYIYIVHPEVIDTKFPDQRVLSKLAISALLSLSSFCISIQLWNQVSSGWPKVRFVEFPPDRFALGIATMLMSVGIPILTSIVFTFILLHKRGKLGNNRVENYTKPTSAEDQESAREGASYGGVWMGPEPDSHATEGVNSRSCQETFEEQVRKSVEHR